MVHKRVSKDSERRSRRRRLLGYVTTAKLLGPAGMPRSLQVAYPMYPGCYDHCIRLSLKDREKDARVAIKIRNDGQLCDKRLHVGCGMLATSSLQSRSVASNKHDKLLVPAKPQEIVLVCGESSEA